MSASRRTARVPVASASERPLTHCPGCSSMLCSHGVCRVCGDCSICGEIHINPAPDGVRLKIYDARIQPTGYTREHQ